MNYIFFMMLIQQVVNVALPKGSVLLSLQKGDSGEGFLSCTVGPYQQPEGPSATGASESLHRPQLPV